MTREYVTVCDRCGRGTWYETEQPCHYSITIPCSKCGSSERSKERPCPGTLRVIDRSGLDPKLAPFAGTRQRVELTYADGETERGIISKSTGWRPVYILLKRRDSSGGSAIYAGSVTRVREL